MALNLARNVIEDPPTTPEAVPQFHRYKSANAVEFVKFSYANIRRLDVNGPRTDLYNLTDKRYISQTAESGDQGIPGPGRQLIATLQHDS